MEGLRTNKAMKLGDVVAGGAFNGLVPVIDVEGFVFEFKAPYKGEVLESGFNKGSRKAAYSHKEFGKVGGVYIIRCSMSGTIKYVGMSGKRLYDMAYRHFQNRIKTENSNRGRYLDTWFEPSLHELALYQCNDPLDFETFLIYHLQPTHNRDFKGLPNVHEKQGAFFKFTKIEDELLDFRTPENSPYLKDILMFQKYGYVY